MAPVMGANIRQPGLLDGLLPGMADSDECSAVALGKDQCRVQTAPLANVCSAASTRPVSGTLRCSPVLVTAV